MPTKKKKLIIDYPDLCVWGIISAYPIHRLAWNINHLCQFELSRQEDVSLYPRSKELPIYFPFFRYENNIDFFTIELLQNRIEKRFFYKKAGNIDYLLIFRGKTDFFNPEEWVVFLNQLSIIEHIFHIPNNQIRASDLILS